MSRAVELVLVLQMVQMEARNLRFWASCCQPGKEQMDRQGWGEGQLWGGPAQPPAPCEHRMGADRLARKHSHSLVEVGTDTFGLLLRKAWMVFRALVSSLDRAKSEQHGSD